MNAPGGAYSMPAAFGPIPAAESYAAPFTAIAVAYRSEADAIARLLPPCYQLAGDPLVQLIYREVRNVDVLAGGTYRMVSFGVTVRFLGVGEERTGSFLLAGWKSHPAPVQTGREFAGQAELVGIVPEATIQAGMADFSCADFSGGELVRGKVRDLQIMELASAPGDDESVNFGWKFIPGPGGRGVDLAYPTMSTSRTTVISMFIGTASFEVLQPDLSSAPMSFHIVAGLRDLPVSAMVRASKIEGVAHAHRTSGRRLDWVAGSERG